MRESYGFNIPKEEHGAFPLAAQDGAVDATKHKIKMFADDLRRMLKGEKPKHRWQFVDSKGLPLAALDAKPKQRLASTRLPENKAAQKRNNPVTPLARQQQSQQSKANLIDRLYGGKGSLEAKLWPDA